MPRRSRRPTGDPVQQASAMVPATLESMRERLLSMAGFPLERRADIIRQAVETQIEALGATRPTKAGEATDWDARLRASDALEHLFGAVASRASTGGAATTAVQVVVELPEYARPLQAGQVTQVIQGAPPDAPDQGYPTSEPSPAPAAPRPPLAAPADPDLDF